MECIKYVQNMFSNWMHSKEKIREIVCKTAELLSSADSSAEITTRKIAENAGINPAMVNYYFGSKENLLKAAVSVMDGTHMTDAPHDPSGSRKAMFDHLVKMCGISIQYAKLGLRGDISSFSTDALETSYKLLEMKKMHDGITPNTENAYLIFKTVCFLMVASADPDGFEEFSGIDIRSKSQLRLLVSKQLDILLGEAL